MDTMAVPEIQKLLDMQRAAYLRDGAPSYEKRRGHLASLKQALLAKRKDFEAAIDGDFGHRPHRETAIMELVATVQGINYLSRNLRRWMRPARRPLAIHFRPARGMVLYQPLGVIGIMSPWNFPVGLALMPLATALAAGNRVMIKPSELTPRTSQVMAEMLGDAFTEEEVAVVQGGPEVGAAFSGLRFDHLFFTGSTVVGRKVHQAASQALVPVTLELGGKSPVLVDRGFPMTRAAKSIAFGKLTNAGQICVSPDYAMVAKDDVPAFVAAFKAAVTTAYPDGVADASFSSIISDSQHQRLRDLVVDAREKGAEIIEINPRGTTRSRGLPPTVILGATAQMRILQEEIFGPILPVLTYETFEETIAYVNARARPLALYLFSDSKTVVKRVLERTTSGNVTVNDTR